MKTRATILAASLLSLAACSGNPSDSGASDANKVSFTFSGPRAGSYTVEGDPPAGRLPLDMTYADGQRFTDAVSTGVSAVLQRGGGQSDWLVINIPGQSPGTFTLDRTGCDNLDYTCADLALYLDTPIQGSSVYSCRLRAGTLRATTVTSTRATGVFSGTGTCHNFKDNVDTPFEVTGGRFDVKLRVVRRD